MGRDGPVRGEEDGKLVLPVVLVDETVVVRQVQSTLVDLEMAERRGEHGRMTQRHDVQRSSNRRRRLADGAGVNPARVPSRTGGTEVGHQFVRGEVFRDGGR